MALTFSAATSRQVERLVDRYVDRFPVAIARALNRAGTSTRAVMARAISKDTGLPVNTVRGKLHLDKATPHHLVVRISVTGKRLPLINFKARGPEPSRGRGRGVTARLPGGAGRYPHAFIATMATGHKGVFQRQSRGPGSRRLPIRQLYGPSLPKVFEKVTPEGLAAGEAALVKNLVSELRFATSGGGSLTTD
jgi:hypothetical protein